MYIKNEDTICAPATVPGTGAISVIRVSGPDALTIADKVVNCRRGRISEAEGYTIRFGTILDADEVVIDEVLVSVFRAPHSYTGENSVEISCHASSYIVARIMDLLYAAGARAAEPGEFTQRAYLNGKMDLAQAEADVEKISQMFRRGTLTEEEASFYAVYAPQTHTYYIDVYEMGLDGTYPAAPPRSRTWRWSCGPNAAAPACS